MESHKNLLDVALNSLNHQAEQSKRAKIFAANQQAVNQTIMEYSIEYSRTVGNLQIKPSIKGDADAQPVQAIIKGETFKIDLNKIELPNSCGGETLQMVIQRLCRKYNIEINSGEDGGQAVCAPVTVALAGKHAEEDSECKGVTKAEFVPVFAANGQEKHVLALSYSTNGETGLRMDNLKVYDDMTCLGRASGTTVTALQAIEIPNLLAAELREEKPVLFDQLQNNACLVIFVEYELIRPQSYSYPYFGETFRGGATRGGETMRGGEVTRGGFNEQDSSTSKGGLSAYSVIGQGSQTQDYSRTVTEEGRRRLQKITVYPVGAMVVNTNGEQLTIEQSGQLVKMLKAREQELSRIYKAYEIYTFNNLCQEVNAHLSQYNVNVDNTNIFEHAMLHLAALDEYPDQCHVDKSTRTPEYFFIDLFIPDKMVKSFEKNLQNEFGSNFCEYTPQFNKTTYDSYSFKYEDRQRWHAFRLPLKAVKEQMPVIKQSMDNILSSERRLKAYQRYTLEKNPYDQVVNKFVKITQELGISIQKTDCVEIVLLNMFACEEELHKARFTSGQDYIGKMTETHFYFDISEGAALELVARMNRRFENDNFLPARFVRANARLPDKGPVDLCEIIVNVDLLLSNEFQDLFKERLGAMQNQPLLLEQLRMQSGMQLKSSAECAEELDAILPHYRSTELKAEEAEPKHRLAEALSQFSGILCTPKATMTDRRHASENVRRAVAHLESNQNETENETFKKGDKKIIKETQKTLGLRK